MARWRNPGTSRRAPSWAAGLLEPGGRLLRRLPVWAKVSAVAGVLLLPLTASLSVVVAHAQVEARATAAELSGMPASRAVSRLMHGVAGCGSRPAAAPDLGLLVARVDAAFRAEPASGDAARRWHASRSRLVGPGPGQRLGCPPVDTREAVARRLAEVLTALADAHRLSLDPEQETYYLQAVMTSHLPRLRTSILALEASTARPGAVGADEAAVGAASLVADAAARVERALGRIGTDLTDHGSARLLGGAAALSAWGADQVRHAEARAGVGAPATPELGDGLREGLRLADIVDRTTAAHLTEHLERRLPRERRAYQLPLAIAAGSIAVVLYLLAALGWSMSHDLGRVHRGIRRALDDTGPVSLPRARGDELASVAAAVDLAQGRISRLVADLRDSAARHESLVRHSSDVTVVTDEQTVVTYVSPSLKEVLGTEPRTWHGCRLVDLVEPSDRQQLQDAFDAVLRSGGRGEVVARVLTEDGKRCHVTARLNDARRDPMVGGVLWNLRDTSREAGLAERLEHRAFHDDLTGLANRALFHERLEARLVALGAGAGRFAVCILDLDRLKETNDRLGHAGGDALLRAVAQRFRAAVRPEDLVARLGGDEFGALIDDADDATAQAVASRLVACLEDPVSLAGVRVAASVSVGVVVVAEPDATADRCLDHADTAMYAAKATGGGLRLFHPSMLRDDPRVAAAEVDELLADPDGIHVVYQPICELGRGEVVGYEALSRFPGREHRTIEEWFRLAEETGRGDGLEAAALRRVLAGPRPAPGYLSVNLSPRALHAPEVERLLAGDMAGMVIEITEHNDLDETLLEQVVAPLRDRGIPIAVDDAGAGHANLRQLVRLRPDIIKLDRALVSAVHRHPEKRALVEALVSFCRRTGAQLCAEGIEEVEELVMLADLGVALGQGWLLGRPAAEFRGASAAARTVAAAGSRAWGAIDLAPVRARIAASTDAFDLGGAMRSVSRLPAIDDVSLAIVSGDRFDVMTQHDWATSKTVFLMADYPASRWALEHGQPLAMRVDDPDSPEPEVRLLRGIGYGSMLVTPVLDRGTPLALLTLFSREARHWSEEERAVAGEVAAAVREALARMPSPVQGSRATDSATSSPDRTAPSM